VHVQVITLALIIIVGAQLCRLSPVDAHTGVALKPVMGNNKTLFTILYCGILIRAQV